MADFNINNQLKDINDAVSEIKGQTPAATPKAAPKFDFFALFKALGNFLSELTTKTSERAEETAGKVQALKGEIQTKKNALASLQLASISDPKVQDQIKKTEAELSKVIAGLDTIETQLRTTKEKLGSLKKEEYKTTKAQLQDIIRATKQFIEDFEGHKIRDSDLTDRIAAVYAIHFQSKIQDVPETQRVPLQQGFNQLLYRVGTIYESNLQEKVGQLNQLDQIMAAHVNRAAAQKAIDTQMKAAIAAKIKEQLNVKADSQFFQEPFINHILEELKKSNKPFLQDLVSNATKETIPEARNNLIKQKISDWFQSDISIRSLIVREGQEAIKPQINEAQKHVKAKIQEELNKYPEDYRQAHQIDLDHHEFELVDKRITNLKSSLNNLASCEADFNKFLTEWSDIQIEEKVTREVRDALKHDYASVERAFDDTLSSYGVHAFNVADERKQAIYGKDAKRPNEVKNSEDALPLIDRLKNTEAAVLDAAKIAQNQLPRSFNAFKDMVVGQSGKLANLKDDNQRVEFLRYALKDAQEKFGEPALQIPEFTGMTFQQALKAIKEMPSPNYGAMNAKAAGELNKRMDAYLFSRPIPALEIYFRTDTAAQDFEGKVTVMQSTLEYWLNNDPNWNMLSPDNRESIVNEFLIDAKRSRDAISSPDYRQGVGLRQVEQFLERWNTQNLKKELSSKLPQLTERNLNSMVQSSNGRLENAQITDPAIRTEVLKATQAKQHEFSQRMGSTNTDDQKALLRDIQQFDPDKLIKDVLKNNLQAAQEASEQAAITRLIPPDGLLAGDEAMTAVKESFQHELTNGRLWQQQLDEAKTPEDLKKLYDNNIAPLLAKQPTSDLFLFHDPSAQKAYQTFASEVAQEARVQLGNKLKGIINQCVEVYELKAQAQSESITDPNEKAAFDQKVKQFKADLIDDLTSFIGDQTEDTNTQIEESLNDNPEKAAALMEEFFKSSVQSGTTLADLTMHAAERYAERFS